MNEYIVKCLLVCLWLNMCVYIFVKMRLLLKFYKRYSMNKRKIFGRV